MLDRFLYYKWLLCGAVSIALIITFAGELVAQNIVSNSGFEMGKVGELPEEWRDQKESGAEGKVILTDKGAFSGDQCLFIEHTNSDGYIHPNKSVDIVPGDYTFSLWARSDKDIDFLAQIYRTTDWSTPVSELCSLKSDKWTKFEFPISSLERNPVSIQIGLTVPGRLWLDDVEIVKKGEIKKKARVQVWDTLTLLPPVGARSRMPQNRSNWREVRAGTTGYSPQGDIVIENGYLATAFCSNSGKVVVYSKSGEKRAEFAPFRLKGNSENIASCKVLENTDSKAIVEAFFAAKNMEGSLSGVFSFSREQIIQVAPAKEIKAMSILSSMKYGILPSFISDDLIFEPENYPSIGTLRIPSESLFLGLLSGGDSMLAVTWPKGEREVKLTLGDDAVDGRVIESIELENDGKSFHLAILDAPGIWHRQELKPSYLEKDITIDWERPFPAKWITQLYEDNVKTTYTFKESKNQRFWRAGVGWYVYPVWFEGGKAIYHLGKKVPPKGESVIYFLERKGTPVSISTFADVIRQTLDEKTYESIVDSEGRMQRSLKRPDCIIGAATCGVTDRLKPVFEAGEEVEKKDYVKGGTEDMIYFLTRERERALEYQQFAREMIDFLALTRSNKPELKPFLDEIEGIAKELITEFEHEKENIKDIEYARKLAKETQAITQRKDPGNFAAYMKLKGQWTGMGGAVDDLNRKLHTITRKLFQQAGYRCVDQSPETVKIAEEIRKRAIKCLRKPGGYEIWSNY